MRLFELDRKVDASGVSGTGAVAQGVEFDDGTCVMRWQTKHRSTALYNSILELELIHGHEGATTVRWLSE